MAYLLADYGRLAVDPLKKAVVDVYRRESMIMDRLTFESANKLAIEIIRTKTLPTVSWRKIGGTFSESKATFEPIQERVFMAGGYIDVDKALVKADSIINQRAVQSDAFVTSLAYEFNDKLINGNPESNVDAPTGLWYRLVKDFDAAQTILGGGLDISPDATGLSANFDIYLDRIAELVHAVDGHKADLLVMNSTLYLRTVSALRQKGLFATTQDSYGRTVATWGPGGPEIIDLGVKADQATNIIGNVELVDGSALTGNYATSVYAAKLGMDKYLCGFQEYDMDVADIGLLESGVAFRTVVDWPMGIYMVNPRSVARLVGIIAA